MEYEEMKKNTGTRLLIVRAFKRVGPTDPAKMALHEIF
jgi:hypothetical protein